MDHEDVVGVLRHHREVRVNIALLDVVTADDVLAWLKLNQSLLRDNQFQLLLRFEDGVQSAHQVVGVRVGQQSILQCGGG